MIQDFIFAALPWVVIAIAVSCITAFWAKKNTKKDTDQ